MADLNDELLNYELGDIDEQDLAVNEDELLLLSDEDSPIKYSAQHEEVLLDESEAWVNSQLLQQEKDNLTQNKSELKTVEKKSSDDKNISTTSKKQSTPKLDIEKTESIPLVKENSNRINSNDDRVDSSSSIVTKDSEVTTTEKSKPKINRTVLKRPGTSGIQEQQSKNDEVTSTNEKLDESIISKSKIELKNIKINTDSITTPSPVKVIESKINVNKCVSDDLDENISEVVSITNESDILELNYSQLEDEGEDQHERRNPKTCVEREGWHDDEDVDRPRKQFIKKPRSIFQLRGMQRLMSPRPNFRQSFPHSSSIENFNPHQSQSYNPQLRLPINIVPYASGGQAQIQPRMGPPGFRMDYRPNYRQLHPQQQQQQNSMRQLLDMSYRQQHPRPEFISNDPTELNSNRPPFRPFNTPQGRPISGPSRFEILRPRIPGPSRITPQQFAAQNRQPFIRQQHILPQLGRGIMICNQRPVQHQITPNAGVSISSTQNILHGQPILPRKVLINPNFKGGVQAATNQLMMDTLNNPQYLQIAQQQQQQNLDDELLRQQEDFINKNRLHIEKRRYETRSPDRNSTNVSSKTAGGDWERGREFSPRRERRGHSRERQYTTSGNEFSARGGRDREKMRFGSSTDHADGRSMPKRRKSGSYERDEDNRSDYKLNVVEEDEETKAYRLEIEKQKAMREKILRDKEMRRRKAAEEKLCIQQQTIQIDQQKKIEDSNNSISNSTNQSQQQQAQKLKPLVVKESKIISLKKNTHTVGPTQRSIPTAKILPETKRLHIDNKKETALVKPVMLKTHQMKHDSTMIMRNELAKKLAAAERDFEDDTIDEEISRIGGNSHMEKDCMYSDNILEEYDEDELLADPTTTPPPPLPNYQHQKNRLINLKDRRRIVIRPSATSSDITLNELPANSTKGIFERLEKKIGVAEAAKRKIQRIVITNTE